MDTPATPAIQTPGTVRRVVGWAARGATAGLLLWICLWTYQGIAALVRPETPPEPLPQPQRPEPFAVLQAEDLIAGGWQFLDSEFEVSAVTLSKPEGEQQVLRPPSADAVASAASSDRYAGMLSVLKRQGQVKQVGEHWRFLLQHAGLTAVLFTRDQAGQQLVAARWLVPLGNQQTWLIEQTPARKNLSGTTHSQSILPKALASRIVTQRHNGQGQMVCQMLVVKSSLAELVEKFRDENWQVDAPAGALEEGFARIYVSRPQAGQGSSESYWLLISPATVTDHLSVLLLRDETKPD